MKDKFSHKSTVIGAGIGALGGTGIGYHLANKRIKKSGLDPNSKEAKRLKLKYSLVGGTGGATIGGLTGANLKAIRVNGKIDRRINAINNVYGDQIAHNNHEIQRLDALADNYQTQGQRYEEKELEILDKIGNLTKSYSNAVEITGSPSNRKVAGVGALVGAMGGAGIGYYLAKRRIKNSELDPKYKEASKIRRKYMLAGGLGGGLILGNATSLLNQHDIGKGLSGDLKLISTLGKKGVIETKGIRRRSHDNAELQKRVKENNLNSYLHQHELLDTLTNLIV